MTNIQDRTEPQTVRIELDIEDELAALNLNPDVLLTPVQVWFSGSSTRDLTVEFEVDHAD